MKKVNICGTSFERIDLGNGRVRLIPKSGPDLSNKFPFPKGGVRRETCPLCGGTIVTTGKGILRQVCSKCGKSYSPRRIG